MEEIKKAHSMIFIFFINVFIFIGLIYFGFWLKGQVDNSFVKESLEKLNVEKSVDEGKTNKSTYLGKVLLIVAFIIFIVLLVIIIITKTMTSHIGR